MRESHTNITTSFVQTVRDRYPMLEVLNGTSINAPGHKERIKTMEIEKQLSKAANSMDLDREESMMDSSFASTQSDMRKSQSIFQTTAEGFGSKSKKAPVVFKEMKEPFKKSKYDEILDTELKFKDFVSDLSMQMNEIKARADAIRDGRKHRTDVLANKMGTPKKQLDQVDNDSSGIANNESIFEADNSIAPSNPEQTTEATSRAGESQKDSIPEIDEEELKKLEEKYKGQFIGSRGDSKAVKRNILIRYHVNQSVAANPYHRKSGTNNANLRRTFNGPQNSTIRTSKLPSR